jgi:hypothetical protein
MDNVISLKTHILELGTMDRLTKKIRESTCNDATYQQKVNDLWMHTDAILGRFEAYENESKQDVEKAYLIKNKIGGDR